MTTASLTSPSFEYTPEIAKVVLTHGSHYLPRDHLPVAEARARLEADLTDAVVNDLLAGKKVNVAYGVSAGVGKTEVTMPAMAKLLAGGYAEGLAYLAPTHENLDEFQGRWKKFCTKRGLKLTMRRIFGKTHVDAKGKTLCQRAGEVERIRELQLGSEKLLLCGESVATDNDTPENFSTKSCKGCPFADNCEWLKQAENFDPTREIILMTLHAIVGGGVPGLAAKIKTILIDESPLGVMIQPLNPADIDGFLSHKDFGKRFKLQAPMLRAVLETLKAALKARKPEISVLASTKVNVGKRMIEITPTRLRDCATLITRGIEFPKADMDNSEIRDVLGLISGNDIAISKMLRRLADLMAEGKKRDVGLRWSKDKFDPDAGVIARMVKQKLNPAFKDVNLILLDADNSPEITQRLFPGHDFRFEKIEAIRHAKVIQVRDSSLTNSMLMGNRKNGTSMVDDARFALEKIASLHAGKKILAIMPMAFEGLLLKGWKLPTTATIATAHFGAILGLDCYKGFDVVAVFGRNQPPTEVMEHKAAVLYEDEIDFSQLTGELVKEMRPVMRASGALDAMPASVHPLEQVQGMMEQHRERQSLQGIDRLRLVSRASSPPTVYVFCDLPLPGLVVNEWISWDAFCGRLNKHAAWALRELRIEKVVALAPKEMVRLYPEHLKAVTTADGAVSDIKLALQAIHDHLPDRKALLTVTYGRKGRPGKPASALVAIDDDARCLDDVTADQRAAIRETLEDVVGETTSFELTALLPAAITLERQLDEFDADDVEISEPNAFGRYVQRMRGELAIDTPDDLIETPIAAPTAISAWMMRVRQTEAPQITLDMGDLGSLSSHDDDADDAVDIDIDFDDAPVRPRRGYRDDVSERNSIGLKDLPAGSDKLLREIMTAFPGARIERLPSNRMLH